MISSKHIVRFCYYLPVADIAVLGEIWIDTQLKLRTRRCSSCMFICNYKGELESVAFVGKEFLNTLIQNKGAFIDWTHGATTKSLSM